MINVKEQITKAKATLILDQPFFASLLLSMPIEDDESIPTCATDGDRIWYNPNFFAKCSPSEILFILAHEVMHSVFQHMDRMKNRHHMKWNMAGDFIINDLLVNEKIGTPPKGILLDPNLVKRGENTTEGVYNLLPDPPEGAGVGKPGGPLDDVRPADGDPATAAQKEAERKIRVIQAYNAAKMCGKVSANIKRIVGEVTQSKVDWRSVLRRFISEKTKVDLTYARPKRRWLANDYYLPSATGEKLGNIIVAVDCSGSIDDKQLNDFASEINAIKVDTNPANITVIYFDSQVLQCDTFGSEDNIELKPVGGGGTDFAPIFQYISDKELDPVACIVLTDLECDSFGNPGPYPVLWTVTGRREDAPFGEVLPMRD